MRVGLFIPCYVDQCYPDVGLASLELLEAVGCEVVYPRGQVCCGQPMANTGCQSDAAKLAAKVVETFEPFEAVVCPSGSCTSMIRNHYAELLPEAFRDRHAALAPRVYDLCEFLHDVSPVAALPKTAFPHRVGLHNSCHGLRELRLGRSSERMDAPRSKIATLLQTVEGLELTDLTRPDECCGFGGTFSVVEEAVSCSMGNDRIADHERNGSEVIAAGDMSCLMHMSGLIRRQKKPLPTMHVAQILAGRPLPSAA